jgi:hypothetical protein
MFSSSRPLGLLRSAVYLSLLGIAVIVLIGPALAVAGVLLPFALIGGLAWGAYRFSRTLVRRVRGDRSRCEVKEVAASPGPIPALFRPSWEERPASRRPGRLGSMVRTAMHVGFEVGCGAALGAALSILADWQTGSGIEHSALGAAIGAVVGFVVGGTRPRSAADRSLENEAGSSEAA